jgi:hypothetical protein
MNRTIDRLKLIFLGVFAVGCVALWAFQIFFVMPAKKCDAQGQWWDSATRICARPIYIPDLTGRPEGMSRKEWSDKKAAEKAAEDREGFTARRAPETATPAAEAPAAK